MSSPTSSSTGACVFPASASQRGLWLIDQLEGLGAAYNIPACFRLRGKLDVVALRGALGELSERHEVLRTALEEEDGEPVQVAYDRIEVDFVATSSVAEPELQAALLSEAKEGFVLERAPLWRARYFGLGDEGGVLLLVLHHTNADGFSLSVLLRDLSILYRARLEGNEPASADAALPELAIQFGDYACWEQERFARPSAEVLAYGRERLAGLPAFEPPQARPRSGRMSFAGRTLRVPLSAAACRRLEARAESEGLRAFSFYLALARIALGRWSGQRDFGIGIPVAGREKPELRDLVGFLTNTVVVRQPWEEEATFVTYGASLSQRFAEAMRHADLPFEVLARELVERREPGVHPLFQVMFAYLQEPYTLPAFGGAEVSVQDLPLEFAHFDLHLEVVSRGATRFFNLEFASERFEMEAMESLAATFEAVLEHFAASPDVAVGTAPVLEPPGGQLIPLSPHQERIWFVDTFESGHVYEGHPIYHNVPVVLRGGPWREEVVREAAKRMVAEHAALRVRVRRDAGDGEAALEVLQPGSEASLPVVKAFAHAAGGVAREAAIVNFVQEPFDLEAGPLFRVGLARGEDGIESVVLVTHHLVADRASMALLAKAFRRLYSDVSDPDSDSALQQEEVVAGFAAAMAAERERQERAWEDHLDFWRDELRLPLAPLTLPADHPRHPVHLYGSGQLRLRIDTVLGDRLRRLALDSGTHLEAVLLAAFQLWLARLSNQTEVVIGLTEASGEKAVAPLANLMVCRETVELGAPFQARLAATSAHLAALRRQGGLSFDRLVSELNPPKDMSRTALFDVLFEWVGGEPGLEPWNIGYGKYDLHACFVDEGEGNAIVLAAAFNRELFEPATLRRYLGYLETLLEGIVAEPQRPSGELPLLTSEEREQLIATGGDERGGYPREATVHSLFEARVEADPEAVAIRDGDETIRYGELNARANGLAVQLLELGVAPDTCVGVCFDRSIECVIAMLGVLKAGCAYLPLDPAFPVARRSWICQDAGLRVVVGDSSSLSGLEVETLISLDQTEWSLQAVNPAVAVDPCQLAYCIYTSGSTGKPKGVLVEHRQVVRLMCPENSPFAFSEGDVWTLFHSPCFDFSVWEIYGALLFGGTLVVVPSCVAEDAARFAELLEGQTITVLNQTPTAFYHLATELAERPRDLSALRTIIFGGETLNPSRLHAFHQTHPHVRLVNMYGITETTVHVTWKDLAGSDLEQARNLIGRPIPTATCQVLDGCGEPVPPGVPGEIYVGGLGVARGYLNRPELTAERFLPLPESLQTTATDGGRLYRSGDLGCRLTNGELIHLGRVDDQVQVRGYRIETSEVEAQLLSCVGVREALVTARAVGEDEAAVLVAYLAGEAVPPDRELFAALAEQLPGYMIPSRFVRVAGIPRTTNGKADLSQLPDPLAEVRSEESALTGITADLAAIWEDLLGVEGIGRDDDFFALGGYSLLATRMLARVERVFGPRLPLRRLFEHSCLGDFASILEQASTEGDSLAKAEDIDRTDRDSGLSSTQRRLWFLDRLEGGSAAYHLFGMVRLDRAVDESLLQRSLDKLVESHPALRSSFVAENGEPVARCASSAPLTLEVMEVAGPEEGRRLARRLASRPFDLAMAPLARACLLRGPEACQLVVGLHHLIADGWSLDLLVRDLGSTYQALLNGEARMADCKGIAMDRCPVPAPLQEGERVGLLRYWLPQVSGLEPLSLPADHPRPPQADPAGAQYAFALKPSLMAALRQFCGAHGMTPFAVCLAAWGLLLSRKARQSSFGIGVPLANRDDPTLQEAVGCFVNTLPAVLDIDESESFRSLLDQVRGTTLDLHDHQRLPFDQLVEAANPPRDLGGHPLYQVLFNYQEALTRGDSAADWPEVEAVDTGGAQVDLALYLEEQGEGLSGLLVYRSRLFEPETVEHYASRFQETLAACLKAPEQPLSVQALLSPRDRRRIDAWNATGKQWEEPTFVLHELVEATMRRVPDQIALSIEDRSMTYRELDQRSRELACQLRSCLPKSDETGFVVAVCQERSFAMVVSLLAVLRAGGAYLPVDPELPDERIARMLKISGAALGVATPALAPRLERPDLDLVEIDEAGCIDESSRLSEMPQVVVDPHSPAYVIFTSGSTGEPKGVVNSHDAICNRLLWMRDYLALETSRDRVLQKTPYSFDVSLWDIFLPLISGVEGVLAKPGGHREPGYLVDLIRECEITVLHFVPSMLQAFLLHPAAHECRSLRHVVCSGEALSTSLARSCHKALPEATLHNLYGPTEAAVDVTAWRCGDDDFAEAAEASGVTIGRPIANLAITLRDTYLREVPVGDLGEICIEGRGLADGYVNRPELTREVFVEEPLDASRRLYRSGDLGRFREDGAIEYHGRRDGQVKLRGLRVELGEIDQVLSALPNTKAAAAVIPPGREVVHGFLVVEGEGGASRKREQELLERLRGSLPESLVPVRLHFVDALPVSRHGKIDRAGLARLALEAGRMAEPARDVTGLFQGHWEKIVAEIWRELLGTDQFGSDDNFFEVGGHSLLLIKAHLALEAQAGVSIELVDLFQFPTVSRLAARLREVAGEPKSESSRADAKHEEVDEIAIIGMAGRFPGATDLEAFREQIFEGRTAIRFYEPEALREAGVDEATLERSDFVPAYGAIDGVADFDAEHFGFSPAEAARLDPQARIFLTCAEEALHHAGVVPSPVTVEGTQGEEDSVGVFAGSSLSTYGMRLLASSESAFDPEAFQTVLANYKDYLATRTAYKLGLRGPAVAVQTACSTSLAAVHLACRAIRSGDCDVALAGGVSVQAGLPPGYLYQKDGILSPDGTCRAFSAAADGTVQGSGGGVVVLKALGKALADGDPVWAVIRGSAMNNDGDEKVGFTAPGVRGQETVIRSALQDAGASSDQISYLEAHGTGTALGDMIEVTALKRVFSDGVQGHCALGAVKAQIGHLDAAAGVAGLIKTVLCLQAGKLPPTLYAQQPNPRLELASSAFRLPIEAEDWRVEEGERRRAGVSSFGIGGTNVHVVLEEAPVALGGETPGAVKGFSESVLVPLSAADEGELLRRRQWLAGWLEGRSASLSLPVLAWSLQSGRQVERCRAVFAASSISDLCRQLQEPEDSMGGLPDGLSGESEALVGAWLKGEPVDWSGLYPGKPPRRMSLPAYPLSPKPHWALSTPPPGGGSKAVAQGQQREPAALFYTLSSSPQTGIDLDAGSEVIEDVSWIGFVEGGDSAATESAVPNDGRLACELPAQSIAALSSSRATAQLLTRIRDLVLHTQRSRARRLLFVYRQQIAGSQPDSLAQVVTAFITVVRQECAGFDVGLWVTDASQDCGDRNRAVRQALDTADPLPPVQWHWVSQKRVLKPSLVPNPWPLSHEEAEIPRLRVGGRYVITGAGGSVARLLALRLAEREQAHLVLLSHRPLDAELITSLERFGVTVDARVLPLEDEALVREVAASCGTVDGVFHLAGVSGERAALPVAAFSSGECEAILAPKVEGTRHLLRHLPRAGRPFFVGFSSLSTVLGGLGFSVYAAANAALDGLLGDGSSPESAAYDCFSLGWDGWDVVGEGPGPSRLASGEALAALEQVLERAAPGRYLIAASPLEPRYRRWVEALLDEKVGAGVQTSVETASPVGVGDRESGGIESREMLADFVEGLWRELLGMESIPPGASFASLGGESLLAVQLLARLSERFPSPIGIREIMEAPSLEALTDSLWQAGELERSEPRGEEREIGEL